jgi:hypothetical protein
VSCDAPVEAANHFSALSIWALSGLDELGDAFVGRLSLELWPFSKNQSC